MKTVPNCKVRMERLHLVQGPETMARIPIVDANTGCREPGAEAVGLPCC